MSSYLFVSYSSIFIRFSMNASCRSSIDWWAQVDSNHRPRAYQARALTTWAMSPCKFLRCISVSRTFTSQPYSIRNHRAMHFGHFGVTSIFGSRLCRVVEMMGIEPMTPCLQGRCSPSWATPPYWGYLLLSEKSLKIEQQSRCTAVVHYLAVFFGFCLFPNYNVSDTLYLYVTFSIERRWSSRTFRYGYLVTT